tara:strand:+ start:450 stop:971 length:522 start_codon:yes stop_codon:yes gene_type:complete
MTKVKLESGPESGDYNGVKKDEYMGRVEGVDEQVRLTFWNPRQKYSAGTVLEPAEVTKTHDYQGMGCYKVKMTGGKSGSGGGGSAPQGMDYGLYRSWRRSIVLECVQDVAEACRKIGDKVSADAMLDKTVSLAATTLIALVRGDIKAEATQDKADTDAPEGMTEAKSGDNIPF